MKTIYNPWQHINNHLDMLEGEWNRMHVTDDVDELERLYAGAKYYLDEIVKLRLTNSPIGKMPEELKEFKDIRLALKSSSDIDTTKTNVLSLFNTVYKTKLTELQEGDMQ